MSVREEFFNTFEQGKILELYRQLTPDERDEQATNHFNKVVSQAHPGDNHNPYSLKRTLGKKS